MTHWSLFMDESGRFGQDRGAVVAGLLVEAPLTHALGVAIKAALSLDDEGIAWPPHSWMLNGAAKLRQGESEGKVTLSKARATFLKRATDAEIDAFLEGARASIREGLGSLRERTGANVWVVGAVCDPAGPVPGTMYGQVEADGYVDALGAVFARVTLLLRDAANPMIVETFVAERNVIHAQLGVPMKLGPLYVRQIATAVTRQIPGGDSVIFAPASVGYYERAHPGVVAADHVVNRLFRKVTNPIHGPWPDVATEVAATVGIPIARPRRARPSPALPLLAAAGSPHAAVLAAANEAALAPLPPHGATWITDQATAWIQELP